MKERLVLDVKPNQLVLTRDGGLKVAFFDKIYEVSKFVDDKGIVISSKEEPRLYIRIENPADTTTIVERKAGDRRILAGEDIRLVPETELFSRAYEKYLEVKNSAASADPYAEIEELKKKLAESEAKKAKTAEVAAETVASKENSKKSSK
jgi:hypothetical protein